MLTNEDLLSKEKYNHGPEGVMFYRKLTDTFLRAYKKFPIQEKSTSPAWKKYFYACYGGAYLGRAPKDPLFFALPMMPDFYPLIVEQFNSEFSNIKIEILKENKHRFSISKDSYNGSILKQDENGEFTLHSPLFTINFKDGFNDYAKHIIQYLISIYLRVFSIPSMWMSPDKINLIKEDINYIDLALNLNNEYARNRDKYGNGGKYRCLSNNEISKELFLALDDIEVMNNSFPNDRGYPPRQTTIFNMINEFLNGPLIFIVEINGKFLSQNFEEVTSKYRNKINSYSLTYYDKINLRKKIQDQILTDNREKAYKVIGSYNKTLEINRFSPYLYDKNYKFVEVEK